MLIPPQFRKLFWDVPVERLTWEEHKYFIMARVLNFGAIDALRWLERSHHFLAELPAFLASTHARKLNRKTLNFWKTYLDIEHLPWETETYKRLRRSSWRD